MPNAFPLLILPGKVAAFEPTPYFGTKTPVRPWTEALPGKGDGTQAFLQVRKALQPGPEDAWHIGLPLSYFTLVNLRLPPAADDDLDQAVRYALLRHVPFDLSQSRVDYARSSSDEDLDVEVSVIHNDQLDALLANLARADIHPAGVFPSLAYLASSHGKDGIYVSGGQVTGEAVVLESGRIGFHAWDDVSTSHTMVHFLQSIKPMLENRPQTPKSLFAWECSLPLDELAESLGLEFEVTETVFPRFSRTMLEQAPYRIGLMQPELASRRRMSLRFRIALATMFLFALIAYPLGGLLGKKAHLQHLESEISKIKPQADIIAEKRLEIQNTADLLKRIAQEARHQPNVLEFLHELTQVLPNNAWLEAFVFSQNRVRIQGQADSATSIIEAMENSPLFKDVRFESPVTRSSNRDVFQISAELVR